MGLIKWDDSYSVHIVEIDKQHQKLVGMLNELNDAMSQGKGKEVIGRIIHDLVNYAQTHFKTEETYFEKFGYPETDTHKKEHADFTQRVSEFKEKFDEDRLGLSIEVMTFLSRWLLNHIKIVDMKYASFFNEKGLR